MTRDRWLVLASVLLVGASIILRCLSLPYSNDDMNIHNLVWYATLTSQGIWTTLGTAFTNYSPPYSYFLALASLFQGVLAPLTAIKLIPIAFDIFGAVLVYKIIRIRYAVGGVPLLAASVYFTAPTVILNSSYWGQVDSLYTVFILASVYFLLRERHTLAWVSLGISFAVKAQAVFIAPLFLLLLLQKRLRWGGIFFAPFIYILSALPTILLGRAPLEALSVYMTQSGTYESLSRNAPNFYMFVPHAWYSVMLPIGVILAGIGMTAWALFSAKYSAPAFVNKNIAFHALVSLALTAFLLPKMHDRYFYPADVLSIVVAFLDPKFWFIPLLFQAVSLPGYAAFLFDSSQSLVYAAAALNMFTIAFLLKRQLDDMEGRGAVRSRMTRALSIIVASIVPMILIGAGIRSIFTPAFIRVEYFLLKNQAVERVEMYQRDVRITEYITGNKGENHLRQLQDGQGNPILGRAERQTLNRIKNMTEVVFDLWKFSLPLFLMMSALFWVYGTWSAFLDAVRRGGRLTLWMAPVTGALIASLAWDQQPSLRIAEGVAIGMFSAAFWLIAAIWVAAMTFLAGLLAAKLPIKTG